MKKKLSDIKNNYEKLNFPVTFALKVIMTSDAGNEKNISDLNNILDKFLIPLKEPWKTTPSKKGNYISYTGIIFVETKHQMYALYGELSKHPDVKYAI